MRLHLPSLRAVLVLAVNTAAHVAEAVLDRADAVVCGWANATGGEDE